MLSLSKHAAAPQPATPVNFTRPPSARHPLPNRERARTADTPQSIRWASNHAHTRAQMSSPPIISNHCLARLTLWLLALLAWFACGCVGERRRRHYGALSIETLERAVRNLIIVHAAQLLAPRTRRVRRPHAKQPHVSLRAIAGVWLRRRLRTKGDLITRAQRLLAVLRTWRVLAADLAHRRRKGLTRLLPIAPRPGHAAPVSAFAALVPCAADTS